MKLLRPLLLLIITFTFSHSLLAGSGNKDIFYDIQQKGEIRVGVSVLPPWVMKNKKGKFIGFEIDIAKQLGKDLGVKVIFKEANNDEAIQKEQFLDLVKYPLLALAPTKEYKCFLLVFVFLLDNWHSNMLGCT